MVDELMKTVNDDAKLDARAALGPTAEKIPWKSVAVLIGVLLFSLAWMWLRSHSEGSMTIRINGEEVTNPVLRAIGQGIGMFILTVLLFGLGVLFLFVFSGVGLFVLTCSVLIGILICAVALPFLLPVLIPVLCVFLYGLFSKKRTAVPPQPPLVESSRQTDPSDSRWTKKNN